MRGAEGATPQGAAVRPQPSRQPPRHGRRRRPSLPGRGGCRERATALCHAEERRHGRAACGLHHAHTALPARGSGAICDSPLRPFSRSPRPSPRTFRFRPRPSSPTAPRAAPWTTMVRRGRGGGLPGRSAAGGAAAREGAAARGWGPPGPVLGKAAGRGGALGSGAGPELCPERRARGPLPQRPQAAAPRSVRLRRCAARPAAGGERGPRRSLLLVFLFFP